MWETDTGCQTTTRRSQLHCAIIDTWHSLACQYLLHQLRVSPPILQVLFHLIHQEMSVCIHSIRQLNREPFLLNYKYHLKVFGLHFKMTAARDEETICVGHVLPLSICLFDIIAIQRSHTKSATGLLLSTWLLVLICLAGDSNRSQTQIDRTGPVQMLQKVYCHDQMYRNKAAVNELTKTY